MNKLIKVSQQERDEIFSWLGGENFEKKEEFLLGSQVSFEYYVENILIKGSGIVLGYKSRLHEKKIILLTPKKEKIVLLLNSKLVKFNLLKQSRLNIRRAKLYHIRKSRK